MPALGSWHLLDPWPECFAGLDHVCGFDGGTDGAFESGAAVILDMRILLLLGLLAFLLAFTPNLSLVDVICLPPSSGSCSTPRPQGFIY